MAAALCACLFFVQLKYTKIFDGVKIAVLKEIFAFCRRKIKIAENFFVQIACIFEKCVL